VSRLRELLHRAIATLTGRRYDREFDDERAAHLALAAADFERRGMSSDAARRAARLAFGGSDMALELHRDARGLPRLENLVKDLSYAIRGLRRDAGLTAAVVLILGLGIGANTAVFSLIRPILLKPLPFERADELVWIANAGTSGLSGATFQVDTFEGLSRTSRSIRDWTAYFAFYGFGNNTLTGQGNPERVFTVDVGPRFFEVLGIQPEMGRLFTQDELAPNGRRVILISHGYWRRRFGSNPSVVGTYLNINDRPTLVAGVLPASFDFASTFAPGTRVDAFTPAILDDMRPWGNTLAVIGRLAPGATVDRARAELGVAAAALRQAKPELYSFGTRVTPLHQQLSGSMRRPLLILWGAVGLVLLIACANVSSLLLSRSLTRTKEFAVRLALGAGRGRILQQLMLEGLLLAACGAGLGVPIAYALTAQLKASVRLAIPLLHHARVDGVALAVTAGLSVATALAFSVLPATRLARANPQRALVDQQRGTTGDRRHARLRSWLVAGEVAMACMLLIGTGLLGRSLLRLLTSNLGFRPSQAHVMTLKLDDAGPNAGVRLEDALRKVRETPGVVAAGLTDALPLDRNRSWRVTVPGKVYKEGEAPSPFVYVVGSGYVSAMGMSLTAGRDFRDDDVAGRPRVVIVSQTLARALYPGQDPLGRPVQIRRGDPNTIIGVVADTKQTRLEEGSVPQMYVPYAQGFGLATSLVVRSSIDAGVLVPAIRQALASVSGNLVTDVRPLDDLVDRSASPRRLLASLIASFSLFALLLSSLGIYGLVAYGVTQRTQEIGVRMALGATAGDVRRNVLGGSLRLAAVGVVLGLLGSFVLSRSMEGMLFETSPTDLSTFLWTAAVMLAVGAAAGYLPAARASRIAPVTALRT
jgi:putative ABC transport system permease protein